MSTALQAHRHRTLVLLQFGYAHQRGRMLLTLIVPLVPTTKASLGRSALIVVLSEAVRPFGYTRVALVTTSTPWRRWDKIKCVERIYIERSRRQMNQVALWRWQKGNPAQERANPVLPPGWDDLLPALSGACRRPSPAWQTGRCKSPCLVWLLHPCLSSWICMKGEIIFVFAHFVHRLSCNMEWQLYFDF